MKKGSATTGIQELGTEVLSTRGSITNGISAPISRLTSTVNFAEPGMDHSGDGFGYLKRRKLPGSVEQNEKDLQRFDRK